MVKKEEGLYGSYLPNRVVIAFQFVDLLHPVVREFRSPTVHERRSSGAEVDLDKHLEHAANPSDMMKRRHSRLMTHGKAKQIFFLMQKQEMLLNMENITIQ